MAQQTKPAKPTYRIKDWDKHFENHESRKVKRSYWVPIPNRHDGKSFRRIAMHPDGVDVFAGWILILEAASKMPVRGTLADEDGPLDSEDLAAMTGFPARIFDAAFNLLTQDKFGWLVTGNTRMRAAQSPATSRNLPESPDATADAALEQKGTEGNRKEQKGREQDAAAPPFAGEAFLEALADYQQHRKEKRATLTPTATRVFYKSLERLGEEAATAALIHSTGQGYTGVFQGKVAGRNGGSGSKVDQSIAAGKRVMEEFESEHTH